LKIKAAALIMRASPACSNGNESSNVALLCCRTRLDATMALINVCVACSCCFLSGALKLLGWHVDRDGEQSRAARRRRMDDGTARRMRNCTALSPHIHPHQPSYCPHHSIHATNNEFVTAGAMNVEEWGEWRLGSAIKETVH